MSFLAGLWIPLIDRIMMMDMDMGVGAHEEWKVNCGVVHSDWPLVLTHPRNAGSASWRGWSMAIGVMSGSGDAPASASNARTLNFRDVIVSCRILR